MILEWVWITVKHDGGRCLQVFGVQLYFNHCSIKPNHVISLDMKTAQCYFMIALHPISLDKIPLDL
jgi:hypothetical protein